MDLPVGVSDLNLDKIPPGCILVRQENGVYSFVKLEPEEQEEIIEQVEEMEINSAAEANKAAALDQTTQMKLRYVGLTKGQTLDELEIDDIPDIIEEVLSPGGVDQAQIEFIEAPSSPEYGTVSFAVSKETSPIEAPSHGSVSWKGTQIPAGLSREEVDRFKAKHILQRLLDQVKRNRSKVEIYSKKNDELKTLISNQRSQMTKMGFNPREIARFHISKRGTRAMPRPLSPEIDKSLMTYSERIAYEKERLETEYTFYRTCLKAILSSHRRYKKIFVENHEKIRKGPSGTLHDSAPFIRRSGTVLRKQPSVSAQVLSDDSNFESEQCYSQEPKLSKRYQCYHCKFTSASKKDLRTHVVTHFIPPKIYECPLCEYNTMRVTQFQEHMKEHPGAKGFACPHCDFKTAHPSALKNHQALHMAVKPYKCPMCTLRFGRSDHLRNHMRCHSNVRSYKCQLCPYSSKHASGLANHTRRIHKQLYLQRKSSLAQMPNTYLQEEESDDPGETTEIEVDETGKISSIRMITRKDSKGGSDSDELRARTSSRQRVKNSVYADYTDGEEFDEAFIETKLENEDGVDEESNDVFIEEYVEDGREMLIEDAPGTYYEDLVKEDEEEYEEEEEEESDYESHSITKMETAPKKDLLSSYVIYQCVWCQYNCEMKSTLLDHFRTHMLSWTFACKACGFVAKSPGDLQDHTEEHNNTGEFDCWYCDYATTNKLKMKKHMDQRHPIGKPMSCMYCNFISSTRVGMKTHMLEHKSKKMWECTACEYKAPFRSSLKRHMRKHTGERPYQCPHCTFNAAQYSHLTRHLRTAHPEEPPHLENRPPSPFVQFF